MFKQSTWSANKDVTTHDERRLALDRKISSSQTVNQLFISQSVVISHQSSITNCQQQSFVTFFIVLKVLPCGKKKD